jgi:hypothetical protein
MHRGCRADSPSVRAAAFAFSTLGARKVRLRRCIKNNAHPIFILRIKSPLDLSTVETCPVTNLLVSRKTFLVLCGLVLLAGGLVLYKTQTKPAAPDDIAAQRTVVAAQTASPRDEKESVALRATVPVSSTPLSAAAAAGAEAPAASSVRSFTAKDQAVVEKRFGKFLQQLSEAEATELKHLLLTRLNLAIDLTARAQQSGGPTRQSDPAGFAAAEDQAKAEIDARISALLGPDRFIAYQAADQEWRSRDAVDNLQKQLKASGALLTAAQQSALQEALTKSDTLQFGVRQITDDVIAGAGAYLSPAQMDGLRQFQRKQQEVVKAKLLLSEKGTANPAPKN